MKHSLMYRTFFLSMLLLAGCDDSPDSGISDEPQLSDRGWEMNAQDYFGHRASTLEQINPANVDRLGLAWEFDDFVLRGRTHRGMESNPIVIGGTMYLVGPWSEIYALRADTGEERWRYVPEVDGQYARNSCCGVVSRGLAVFGDILYTATLDGYLIAVNRFSGQEIWKVDTFYDRKWSYSITGAPWLAGNKILIGNAGSEMGARGYVSAYDASSGELVWRFWAVPGDPATEPDESSDVAFARATWPEDTRWDLGLGGTAWDSMAYDPATNVAYLGLGNGSPHAQWLRSESGAGGDNLYLSSIVAVDADTGERLWHYQTTPGDSWDYTATSPIILATLEFQGEPREVLMQAPKNGFFYVLDRHTGELLTAEPYTTVTWATHVDMETGRPVLSDTADYSESPQIIWPSVAGGHSWHPMALSEKEGLVYLPVTDAPMRFDSVDRNEFLPGTNYRMRVQFPPFNNPGDDALLEGQPAVIVESRLRAIDPVSGDIRWQSEPLPFISGGTLVVNSMVFQGASDGFFRAFDASTGQVLTEINLGTSIMAAPITYILDGVQYIAVTAGAGGPKGSAFSPGEAGAVYQNYERLLVFRLDGESVDLPPLQPERVFPDMPEVIEATSEQMAIGQELFETHCERCHRLGGALGNYPDLWRMPPETIIAFESIVGEGAMATAGMADFSDVLSQQQIQYIKAFIVNDTITKRQLDGSAGASSNTAYH